MAVPKLALRKITVHRRSWFDHGSYLDKGQQDGEHSQRNEQSE
jgi:hypothetical protein